MKNFLRIAQLCDLSRRLPVAAGAVDRRGAARGRASPQRSVRMTKPRLDVLAIGNAIVDIIADCDDSFLEAEGLAKGSMRLIDAAEATRLYSHMGQAREITRIDPE